MPNTRIPVAVRRSLAELARAAEANGKGADYVVGVIRELADIVTTSSPAVAPRAESRKLP